MLLVRTYTAPSPIHGTGLFAAEHIPAGTPTWRFDPSVDRRLEGPPPPELADYCWRDLKGWVMPGDDSKYMNHAWDANTYSPPDDAKPDVALRDIQRGEEITVNYTTFDLDCPSYVSQLRTRP